MANGLYFKPPVRFTLPEGSEPTDENIDAAIAELRNRRARYKQLYNYYIGNQPILRRKLTSDTAKNNTIVNNFASYIADIGADYLLGNPADYIAPEDADITEIIDRYKEQGLSDVDSDIALDAGIYGVAYDLTFADEDSEPKTVSLDPRNTIMVYDDSVQHRELFAIHAADYKDETGAKKTALVVYTDSEIITGTMDGGTFQEAERKPHFFQEVPVIEYLNNKARMGDYEPVLQLIDAYNTIQSDRVNDREALADAILVLKNFTLNNEKMAILRDKRLISSVPADGDAFYLTKQLSEADADILKRSIADDIHKFSKTPNLSDENFVGNSSGVALNYKLLAFEEKTKTKERHIEKGLKKRIRLYYNFLQNRGIITGDDLAKKIARVDVVFNRNLPKNDYETSQMIVNLQGIVKPDYLVKQLSFIDDAEKALEEQEPDENPEQFPALSQEDIQADLDAKLMDAAKAEAEEEAAAKE